MTKCWNRNRQLKKKGVLVGRWWYMWQFVVDVKGRWKQRHQTQIFIFLIKKN